MGCGYIGKKLARLLFEQEIMPGCIVHSKGSADDCLAMGLSPLAFDLDKADRGLSEIALREAVLNVFEDAVVAYFVPPQPQGDSDQRMQNFVSMLDGLTVAPEKILLISTTGVYGDCHGEWIDEQRATMAQVDRARRRLSAESRLQKYCDLNKTALIIFRVPGIYAVDKLPLKRILSGQPIVNADDSGFTNRIHADDLSAFCAEALMCDVTPGIYNCCDGAPSTMNDYFMKVADAAGLVRPAEISLLQAQQQLSKGMLSYLAESKRISNEKLLMHFKTKLKYPDLSTGLQSLTKPG